MTHVRLMLILLLALAACVRGEDGPADPLVARSHAHAAALAAEQLLLDEVRSRLLPGEITVGRVVDAADASAALQTLVAQAEQVGGPRWIDPQTCQVRRQLPARMVRDLLRQIEATRPDLPATAINADEALRSWDEQVFTAVGTSMSPAAIGSLVPRPDPDWAGVSESRRRQAITRAHDAAVTAAIERIGSLPLDDQTTLRQRLATDPTLAASLRAWVSQRPVTAVSFDRAATVGVTIAMPPDDVADWLRARQATPATLPSDLTFVSATATAPPEEPGSVPPLPIESPPTAPPTRPYPAAAKPEWARKLYLVEGSSPPVGSRLRTARAAEDVARQRLGEQVRELPISEARRVGDFMRLGETQARAVDRVLSTASTTRITYLPDGSATVQMMIDGRSLWQVVSAE